MSVLGDISTEAATPERRLFCRALMSSSVRANSRDPLHGADACGFFGYFLLYDCTKSNNDRSAEVGSRQLYLNINLNML